MAEARARPDGETELLAEALATSGDAPLVDSVYRVLRDAICDGRLEPNRKLAQIPLAEQLGISRTPVRDALQRLASEGLVRAVSWRGFVVSEFSAQDVLEIYDVRLAIEPVAAREAYGHHTRLDFAELADNCDRTVSIPRSELWELYELNRQFHAGVIRPCGNRLMVRMLDQLWQMPASRRLFHVQAVRGVGPLSRSHDEHLAILDALEDGDESVFLSRVRGHIEQARSDTLAGMQDS